MAAVKYSRQRELIISYLHSTTAHPTAETIFQQVRAQCPSISLGTVYRNLKQLENLGTIRRITCGDGCEHFDGNVSPHYHLYCRSCGSVSDLKMPVLTELNLLASHYCDGTIERHSMLFHGLCAKCSGFAEKTQLPIDKKDTL